MKAGRRSIGEAMYSTRASAMILGAIGIRSSLISEPASEILSRNGSFAIRFASFFSSERWIRHHMKAARAMSRSRPAPITASETQKNSSIRTFYSGQAGLGVRSGIRSRPQICKHLFRVLVRREHRVEHLFDAPIRDDERQPFDQRHATGFEHGQAERVREFERRIAE